MISISLSSKILSVKSSTLAVLKTPLSSTTLSFNVDSTNIHKNNDTNDEFYRKVAFLMYTEMFNFRPQS